MPFEKDNATILFVVDRINRILDAPGMWGSPDAVEQQVLTLLEVHAHAKYGGKSADTVRASFVAYCDGSWPGSISSLATRLGATNKSTPEFISGLRLFTKMCL